MSTPQQSINSGFGAKTTAAEVLEGIDLTGKHVLVTGGYSGIGLETTKAVAAAGAEVLVPARRPKVAEEALDGIAGVETDELDLADLASVQAFADRRIAVGRPFDAVIDSAGVMACPETRVGPGWELQFATNHLGHFALVNRLAPLVSEGARVVSVSSGGHRRSAIRWDDPHFERGYDRWEAYGQSKTANVLFAVHLDRLAQDRGIRAFALHPGGILTPLQRHVSREDQVELGWIDADGNPVADWFKTPEQGAATQTWAAFSPQLDGKGGVYLQDCDVAEVGEGGVAEYAVDPDEAERLWALSAELTGVDGFGR
ncbi:SDR family NAD(P)-dependent oxidoreductase [Glycomyces artemisiae]|uniref:Probable oxidoreductase n=1 Tax=Glycomyces artemisiae TaxID=1076443 RepID=A0A2T0UF02_9ACTN|nr:SDR family NAD(P)-dependent oxidoreductase [Glycomyces artemisiae]PRY56521.1 NAD(P)-dependent dehydrogenase (short-subunit alcohol dehydrogenase family) [Glycomyces artemisiae]